VVINFAKFILFYILNRHCTEKRFESIYKEFSIFSAKIVTKLLEAFRVLDLEKTYPGSRGHKKTLAPKSGCLTPPTIMELHKYRNFLDPWQFL
jgi:hypothetical protein